MVHHSEEIKSLRYKGPKKHQVDKIAWACELTSWLVRMWYFISLNHLLSKNIKGHFRLYTLTHVRKVLKPGYIKTFILELPVSLLLCLSIVLIGNPMSTVLLGNPLTLVLLGNPRKRKTVRRWTGTFETICAKTGTHKFYNILDWAVSPRHRVCNQ